MDERIYDLIIIGAGPAGLAASIYASRYKVDHIVVGGEPGGQVNEAHLVENWPGTFSITGVELAKNMRDHAEKLGAKILMETANAVAKSGEFFSVATHTNVYKGKKLILAQGIEYRKLKIPGEERLKGHGVSYCATCDATFFKDKVVAVVGGGNSAASAVSILDKHASRVYMIYRGDRLKCDPVYCSQFEKRDKIEVIYKTNIKEIVGEKSVEKIILDKPYKESDELEVQGVFIEIGSEPGLEIAKSLGISTDEQGFIVVKEDQSTNVEGIWAAGDATSGSNKFRQIITASAEGAIAAGAVHKKLQTS